MVIPPTDKPVLIVQHEAGGHPGTLFEAFSGMGLRVDVWQLHAGEGLPTADELDCVAALVVLGGSMNTDQVEEFPFIEAEQELLRQVVARGLPVLGICLGAQQLAVAVGGEVYRRDEPEVGYLPVEIAARDGLFTGMRSPLQVIEWHAYSFTVPDDALVLARRDGDRGVQAFRYGERAWGVQFHPEVDEGILEHWIARDNKGIRKRQPELLERLHDEAPTVVAASRRLCRRLVANFVAAL
jgi:GMP synthase (glutamine-hydrolysing)